MCVCVRVCVHRVLWVNCRLNYAEMKINLTSHFLKYIYQNYMKIFFNNID